MAITSASTYHEGIPPQKFPHLTGIKIFWSKICVQICNYTLILESKIWTSDSGPARYGGK